MTTRRDHDAFSNLRENRTGGEMVHYFRHSARAAAFSLFVLQTASAQNQEVKREGKKAWTFLFYINADNNLETSGYNDIREMEKIGSSRDVNLVVQFDGINPIGTRRFLVEKNTKPYRTKNDCEESNPYIFPWGTDAAPMDCDHNPRHTFHSKVLEDLPEQDMGDPKTFIDFVEWGMKNYPAENYMVLLWNHGSGWDIERTGNQKGLLFDDTSGHSLRTNQVRDALRTIKQDTQNRISILAFDACLMAMYEVATSLQDDVDYLVASEETIPSGGFAYDDFLQALYERHLKDSKAVLSDLISSYQKSYSGGSQGFQAVTLSVIDLSKLNAVTEKLNEWVKKIQSASDVNYPSRIRAAIDKTLAYGENDYKDLGHYLYQVMAELFPDAPLNSDEEPSYIYTAAEKEIQTATDEIHAAIADAVIMKFNSTRYQSGTGLSIYLPSANGMYNSWTVPASKRRQAYLELDWAKKGGWPKFLDYAYSR